MFKLLMFFFCTVYDEGLALVVHVTSTVLIMDVDHTKKSCIMNHFFDSSSRGGFTKQG